ncbi:YncE family protein [Yinghuangia seranimata]|uniref:YncE family protein n=1 Tax=Yinghuangia seranimata TaxID=408067 RepID=UPI00248B11FB|nr:YncE family protein [Yinghuangia seranimata]MDI2129094.1 YncE family protein [Yinghuangia seranimata]
MTRGSGRGRGLLGRRGAWGVLAAAAVLAAGCSAADQGSGSGPGTAARPGAAASAGSGAAAGAAASPGTSAPATVAVPGGETLLVADFGSDTVTFVDPARGATGSVGVGTAPYGIALGADGRAWVTTAEGVAVVDTGTRTTVARIPYATKTGPVRTGEYRGGGMGIALSPDGARAYVGVNVPGGDGVLEVVDTASLRVVGTAEVGRRPFDVEVARDGSEAYSVDHDSYTVTAVRAGDLAARRMTVAPYGTAGGLGGWLKPHYAAVRADGRLALPFEGERLAVLDPRTGAVAVERMGAGTHQHGVAETPDGRLLVVGTGSDGTVDGPPSLTIREKDGRERVVRLQGAHEDVAVSRDGKTAYVTGGFTRDGYWNGITVVDVDSGTAQRVAAGARPLGVVVLPAPGTDR